jgi:hypothetical protein
MENLSEVIELRKFIVLLLIISFLGMNCATIKHPKPSPRRGATLLIQTKGQQPIKGELIAVKWDAILLKLSYSSFETSLDIDDIKIITIMKGTKTGIGAISGFVIGGAIGVFLSSSYKGLGSGTPSLKFCYGTFFGFLGGLVGYVIDGDIEGKEIIQIEGKSDSEIKKILEDLRKKARVPNFQ